MFTSGAFRKKKLNKKTYCVATRWSKKKGRRKAGSETSRQRSGSRREEKAVGVTSSQRSLYQWKYYPPSANSMSCKRGRGEPYVQRPYEKYTPPVRTLCPATGGGAHYVLRS